jgi:DNA-binding MarR family transcriptional regulator
MSTEPGTAARVWQNMRTLVVDQHDRRKAVCEALDMSFMRAKALRSPAAGPMSIRDLAERLAIDRPYTTLIVDDLERRSLVERRVDQADRRAKIVTITPPGRRAAELADRILGEPPEPLRAPPAPIWAHSTGSSALSSPDDRPFLPP